MKSQKNLMKENDGAESCGIFSTRWFFWVSIIFVRPALDDGRYNSDVKLHFIQCSGHYHFHAH